MMILWKLRMKNVQHADYKSKNMEICGGKMNNLIYCRYINIKKESDTFLVWIHEALKKTLRKKH